MGLRPAPPVHVDLLAGHTVHHVRSFTGSVDLPGSSSAGQDTADDSEGHRHGKGQVL